MALDGLSNQSVGIYRSKDPTKTTDKLTAKSKEMAEKRVSDVDDAYLIEKTNPDDSNNQKNTNKAFFAPDIPEEEVAQEQQQSLTEKLEEQELQYQIDEYNAKIKPKFFVSFNAETKMVEFKSVETNELLESIHPKELLKVLAKAKDISGMFIDKEI